MLSLTALDRCDRCGAQAKSEARKGKKTLLFCGHHTNKHIDSLTESGWVVETEVIEQVPVTV